MGVSGDGHPWDKLRDEGVACVQCRRVWATPFQRGMPDILTITTSLSDG